VSAVSDPPSARPRGRAPAPGVVEGRLARAAERLCPLLPWIVLGLVGAFLLALGGGAVFPDSWFGLVGGRELLQHGFTTTNTWTRYGSRQWIDQQWAAHLAFYGVWRLAGAAGLVALNIAVVLSGLAFCVRAATRRGGGAAWTSLLLAVVFIAANTDLWYARAQSFSVLCFGVLAWILTRDDGRLDRGVFAAIPLVAVWANLHAAVLVGGGVCVLYAASCLAEPRRHDRPLGRRALALMAGSSLACFATPLIASMPWYLRQTMANPDFKKLLPEWLPTTLGGSPVFVLAAFAALAISASAPIARRDKVLVWLLTIAGFAAVRSELWACLIWLVVLPGALERLRPVVPGRRLRRLTIALAVLLPVSLAAAAVQNVRAARSDLAAAWPRAAAGIVTAELRRDPGLKVFADQPLADWLLYEAPSVRGRLAIDGRFEVFDHRTFDEVFALSAEQITIAPRIAAEDMYVLAPTSAGDARLVRVLERQPEIVPLYRSSSVVILRRR
jgi:hypothetical protein